MEFIVDKEAKTVSITEVFDADRDLVWEAYTRAELLDKWWAPKPFTSRTVEMNFVEGGRRFYAMVSPEGQEGWILQQFKTITEMGFRPGVEAQIENLKELLANEQLETNK